MALEWQSVLLGAGATGGIGLFGYLGKRVLPWERRKTKTDEYGALTTIAATMKEKNISHEEIQALAALLRGEKRQARAESIFSDLRAESRMEIEEQPDRYWTQASMSERAAVNLRKSEAKLDDAIIRFRQLLTDEEEYIFNEVQLAWKAYRDRQADFAAAEVAGGTMESIVLNSEKELMTEARARELEEAFKERAEQQGLETG